MWTAARARRHFNRGVLLRASVIPAWAAASLFGIYRLAIGPFSLLVGGVALLLALGFLLWRFRRLAWTTDQAAVLLDRAAGAGGLLLALSERPDPRWSERLTPKLQKVDLPREPVRRQAAGIVGAFCFAAVALAFPEAQPPARPLQNAAESRVNALDEKAELLAEENALAENLAEELARLQEEARSGSFDAADWEASDVVESALSDAAASRESALADAEAAARELEAAMESNAGVEELARAKEALEDALASLGDSSSASEQGDSKSGEGQKSETGEAGQQEQAGEQGQSGQQSGQQKQSGQQGEKGSGQQSGQKQSGQKQAGNMKSPADAKAMAESLQKRREALQQAFNRQQSLAQSQKSSRPKGEKQSGGQCPHSDHSAAQCPNAGQGEGESEGESGSGAPTRGGGVAPVTYGQEVQVQAERLKLESLPQSEDEQADQLLGIERHAPRTPDAYAPTAPGVTGSGADGVGPRQAPVPPRHRELLRRYFDPGEKR